MGCGFCGGGGGGPTARYVVTGLEDGTPDPEGVFLTETEARMFTVLHGGGTITREDK